MTHILHFQLVFSTWGLPLNILVIDDHPLVAEGIVSLLSTLGEDVSATTVTDGAQGIEKALIVKPDLILLDLHMPNMGGLDALKILGEKLPSTSVVIVSASLEKADMQAAMRLGAMGFIPKSASSDIMMQALKLVLSGGIYVPPEMLDLGNRNSPAASTVKSSLTPRQIEVLKLLSEGKVNKEIARQLDCAETTVKAHVTAVFRELGASNRTEAVINAQKAGLL